MVRLSRFVSVLTAAGALVASATAVQASGAHFTGGTSDGISPSGQLVVTVDEVGVGNQDVQYVVEALSLATYACVNSGDHAPRSSNKQTFSHGITGSFLLTPADGRVNATLWVDPVGPGSFTCPSGQNLVLAGVSYRDVSLSDVDDGVSMNLPDVSHTFYAV